MFANLNPGSSLHVLKTVGPVQYNVCQIEQIRPSFSYNFGNGAMVDITITIDGTKKEFSGVSANSEVSISNGYIITSSKDAMIGQLNNFIQSKQDAVDNIEIYKQNIAESKEILKKLNPSFAKEQAIDGALNSLTDRVNKMQDEFGDIKNDVRQVLSILTNKNN